MAAQIFPYGTALTVVWHLSKPDGTDFDITGYTYRVYYRTGNKETEANGSHVTASGNTISIVIPATEPSAPGEYALRLVLYQNNKLFCTLNYNGAFVLSRRLAQDLAMETQQEEVQIVHLYTVAEFYLFTPIIPTVGSDGYWYVNGTKVTDGHGEFVPSSHTMEYDAQTNYIIIDRDRVDSRGQSIAQTITSLADALSTAAEDHETAQEDHSTAAGDHQTASADHSTATWDHQAIVDMIDLYEPITINGDVTNAPDEEDITSDENDLLKFKDRGVIYGMGYCILRRNKTFAEQVTKINTIYEIRYDFDLDGESVTIPENCVLKFVGGKIINATLVFQNTFIDAEGNVIFDNCTLSGSIKNDGIKVCWFGCLPDDDTIDCTGILQKTLGLSCRKYLFDAGTYYFSEWLITEESVSLIGVPNSAINVRTTFMPFAESQYYIIKLGGAETSITMTDKCRNISIIDIAFCTPQGFEYKNLTTSLSTDNEYICGALVLDFVEIGKFSIIGSGIHNMPLMLVCYAYECSFDRVVMYGNHGKSDLPIISILNDGSHPISAFSIDKLWVEVFVGPILWMHPNANISEINISEVFIEGSIEWERESIFNEQRFTDTTKDIPTYYSTVSVIPMFKLANITGNIESIIVNGTDTEWINSLDGQEYNTRGLFELTYYRYGNLKIGGIFNGGYARHHFIEGTRGENYTSYIQCDNAKDLIFWNASNVAVLDRPFINYTKPIKLVNEKRYAGSNLLDVFTSRFVTNLGYVPGIGYNKTFDAPYINSYSGRYAISANGLIVNTDYLKVRAFASIEGYLDIPVEYYSDTDSLITTESTSVFFLPNKIVDFAIKINREINYSYLKVKSPSSRSLYVYEVLPTDSAPVSNYIVLSSAKSFSSQVTKANTVYEIRDEFDLNDGSVTIPAGCTLRFVGGKITNGTLVGHTTEIEAGNKRIFGNDIDFSGTWNVYQSYSDWFAIDCEPNALLAKLAVLSNRIFLNNNRQYEIEKQGTTIECEELYGNGTELNFHVASGQVEGINIVGEQIHLAGFKVTEDADGSSSTVGNTFRFVNCERCVIENISFSGTTESSLFSSPSTVEVYVSDITAQNALFGDHLLYYSTEIEVIDVRNVSLTDATARGGLFKSRSNKNRRLSFSDITLIDGNSGNYIFVVGTLDGTASNETPVDITISRVNATVDYEQYLEGPIFFNFDNATGYTVRIEDSYLNLLQQRDLFNEGGTYIAPPDKVYLSRCTIKDCRATLAASQERVISNCSYELTRNINNISLDPYGSSLIIEDTSFVKTGDFYSQAVWRFYGSSSGTRGDILVRNVSVEGYNSSLFTFEGNYTSVVKLIIDTLYSNVANGVLYRDPSLSTISIDLCVNNLRGNMVSVIGGAFTVINQTTRPSSGTILPGYSFFDASLTPARPIWWTGTAWVDATGTTVE